MILIRYLTILSFAIALYGCRASTYPKSDNPKVPHAVIEKVDSIFPGDKPVQWTKYYRKYRADFLYNELNVSITLERDGDVVEGTEEIKYSALPSSISNKIQTNYASFKILMITLIYKKNSIQYEIEIIRGKFHYILNYNKKGFLIHQYTVVKNDLIQFSTD